MRNKRKPSWISGALAASLLAVNASAQFRQRIESSDGSFSITLPQSLRYWPPPDSDERCKGGQCVMGWTDPAVLATPAANVGVEYSLRGASVVLRPPDDEIRSPETNLTEHETLGASARQAFDRIVVKDGGGYTGFRSYLVSAFTSWRSQKLANGQMFFYQLSTNVGGSREIRGYVDSGPRFYIVDGSMCKQRSCLDILLSTLGSMRSELKAAPKGRPAAENPEVVPLLR